MSPAPILQSTNNGLGFAGIAYAARLLPVEVVLLVLGLPVLPLGHRRARVRRSASFEGGCATADVVAGIRAAADAGAKVINLSLGGPGQSPAYAEAINYAVQRGAFVAMAVGNEFEDGNPVEYPAAYGTADCRARCRSARSAAASRRAFYSNTGSAPGDRRAGRRFA